MTFHIHLPPGKKVYFASDFHLGAPSLAESRERERKVVRWMGTIEEDAHAVYFLGDIFDFWYEYKHAIPKGFARFQGKVAALTDAGIKVYFLSGNHDMWMFGYFPEELGIAPILHGEHELVIGDKNIFIAHGDGLGNQDLFYTWFLKRFFRNRLCQWLFARIHPNLGMTIARTWSAQSRKSNEKRPDQFYGDKERLLLFCKETEQQKHHDYYLMGHRHRKMVLPVSDSSTYMNLGDWMQGAPYAVFDGHKLEMHEFEATI